MDRDSEQQEIEAVTNKLDAKMERLGYSQKERNQVTIDAVARNYKKTKRCLEYGLETHRDGAEGISDRRLSQLNAKREWFRMRSKRDDAVQYRRHGTDGLKTEEDRDNLPISVFFVPRTPGG